MKRFLVVCLVIVGAIGLFIGSLYIVTGPARQEVETMVAAFQRNDLATVQSKLHPRLLAEHDIEEVAAAFVEIGLDQPGRIRWYGWSMSTTDGIELRGRIGEPARTDFFVRLRESDGQWRVVFVEKLI